MRWGKSGWGAALLAAVLLLAVGCGGKGEPAKPAAGGGEKAGQSGQTGAKTEPVKGTRYQILPDQSSAWYTVKEVFLIDQLNATAIGKTSAIAGDLVLDGGALQPAQVKVDVSKLKSDKEMRDNKLKSAGLETTKYPEAIFTVASGSTKLAEGQETSLKLNGKATIHGVEKDLVWDAKAKLEGDKLTLTGEVTFKMDLFAIEPPNIAGRIRVDDTVKLNVSLVATKAR